jgi:T5SS/PEP-CTERM-associated repeat protein
VDGAGSTLVSGQAGGTAVVVGFSGAGTMTVQNGGTYQGNPVSQSIVLGQQNGSSGTLTVTGAGSSVTTGGVSVGQGGPGTVNVLAGGTLSAGRVQIGEVSGGPAGSVTVSGAGSTLTSPNGLFVGGTAVAAGATGSQLTIANGGSVTAATVLGTQSVIYAGSTLTINGGSLTTGNLTRSGTLALNDGTLTINAGFLDAGSSATPLSIQGNAAGTLATLDISNSTTSNIGTLAVGGTRPGAVVIGPGGNVTPNAVTFATSSTGNGSISLSGPNAVLNVATTMALGSTGQSSLSVGNGSAVTVNGTLTLGSAGTINLTGGSLTVGGLTFSGGAVNWTSGTVAFTGAPTLGASELTTLLGPGGTLSAGKTLKGSPFSASALTVSGNLTVAGGTLTATDVINTATLNVTAGTVQGTTSVSNPIGALLSLANGATLSGQTFNGGELQFGGGAARLVGQLSNTGRVSGTGTVTGNLINNPNGVVSADAGQRLVFGGAGDVNATNATIQLTGGTIEFTGQLSNQANGLISGRGVFRGSTANASGTGLNNTGAVAFSAGTSDVYGKVTNGPGGQIVTAGGGVTTFHDDVVHNGTEIRTNLGSRTVFFGAESGAGPFTGTGTVEFAGDLRPGNSPARVTFGGDVVLDFSAGLQVELGGTTAGSQYDQLAVTGAAALDGGLRVAVINGFTPQAGNRFDILTYGSHTGDFASFSGLDLGNGLALVPDVTPTTYSLVVTAVPEPGALALAGLAAVGVWRRVRRIGGRASRCERDEA